MSRASASDGNVPGSEEAAEFLRVLWPHGLPGDAHITVASRNARGRGWNAEQFTDLNRAAECLCAAPDRYLTCGAMRHVHHGRGCRTDVLAIPGLWMDVDTASGTHKERRLPHDDQAAVEFVSEITPPPSIILNSGGGLHVWWLFEEPWVLEDEATLREASCISKGLQEHVWAGAEALGWRLDRTADLTRCLRAPGALNGKYDPPRRVVCVAPAELRTCARYPRTRFESFSTAGSRPTTDSRSADRPSPVTASCWLGLAAAHLGGASKRYEDEHGGGIVLRVCPSCGGAESKGTVAEGTAHLCRRSGRLRCKRSSCEASDGRGGLAFEVWSSRFLSDPELVELRVRRVQDPIVVPSLTDDGNAIRLARRHGADIRWSEGLGWLRWDGRRFLAQSTSRAGISDAVIDLARETIRGAMDESRGRESSELEQEALAKHMRSSLSEKRLKSMVSLARCELSTPESILDRDPRLLNVQNGTLNLHNGELRPHDRADNFTKLAPVEFHPAANSNDVERFLFHATRGDSEFRAFLERLLGYTVWGEKPEDMLIWLHGPGGTGKSTLLEALRGMLGDYAAVIPFDALRSRGKSAGPRPELAGIRGARLVTASEVADGADLDAAMLKSMSGGDTLNVRELYRDPIRFRPASVLWLAANHAPRLDRRDSGARRRLKIIPFKNEVPNQHVDPGLRARLREPGARAAWLAIAVRGCRAWQSQGTVGSCQAVDRATLQYWEGEEAGTLQDFVNLLCLRDATAWTATAEVESRLREFSEHHRVGVPTLSDLGGCLEAHGYERVRRRNARGWRMRLRPAPSETKS